MLSDRFESPIESIDCGSILVASPEMEDRYFKDSVILIVDISAVEVLGFVLNRPLCVPVNELFEGFENIDKHFASIKRRVFAGGPLEQCMVSVISFSLPGGQEIAQGLRWGGHWNTLVDLVESDQYEHRLHLGYTCWGVKQLINEIAEGNWIIYKEAPLRSVFNAVDSDEMQTSEQAISVLDSLTWR